MKESAGEANMTVITIVLIGLVAAAGAIIIPNLLNGMAKKACCNSYGGTWESNACKTTDAKGTKTTVKASNYWDDSNKKCAAGVG